MTTPESSPLRVLVVGAHPDEADMYAGGTAALFARMGHEVRFLSLTCGDAGHHEMERFALAARRKGEADEAARRLGVVEYQVLDTHDGELMPSLETRYRVMRSLRDWNADVVIGLHYEPDGHPDHRAAGRATADAVQFSTLRNVMPETPALSRQPIHLLMPDYGSLAVHRHDLVIDVDDTIEQKLRACDAHATQFYEFAPFGRGFLDDVPEGWEAKRAYLLRHWPQFMYIQPETVPGLAEWYGEEHAATVQFTETFQFSGRGQRPDHAKIRRLFPMLPEH